MERGGERRGGRKMTIHKHSRNTGQFKILKQHYSKAVNHKELRLVTESQVQKDKWTANNRKPCIKEWYRERMLRKRGRKKHTRL